MLPLLAVASLACLPGSTSVTGPLAKELTARVLTQHEMDFQKCFAPGAPRSAQVQLVIHHPSGQVKSVTVAGDPGVDAACQRRAVEAVRFPQCGMGLTQVSRCVGTRLTLRGMTGSSCRGNACVASTVRSLGFVPPGKLLLAKEPWSDVVSERSVPALELWSPDPTQRDGGNVNALRAEATFELNGFCASNRGAVFAVTGDGGQVTVGGRGEVRQATLEAEDLSLENSPNLLRPSHPKEWERELFLCKPTLPETTSLVWTEKAGLVAVLHEPLSDEWPWKVVRLGVHAPQALLGHERLARLGALQPMVLGFTDSKHLAIRAQISDPPFASLLLFALAEPSSPSRRWVIPPGAQAFVWEGQLWLVNGQGVLTRIDEREPVAQLDFPPLSFPHATREVLAASADSQGRLAVAVTERLNHPVGRLPCCTRVLWFERDPGPD